MNRSIKATERKAIEILEARQLLSAAQFFAPVPYSTGAQSLSGAAVADFNHDGKQDVAVMGAGSNGVLEWFAGDGHGVLGAAHVLNHGYYYQAIAAGDFNGDGFADIAVGTSSGVDVYLNNQSGGLSAPQSAVIPFGVNAMTGIYAENNNREEIAIGNTNKVILLDLGAGGKPQIYDTINLSSNRFPIAMAAGDFDDDHVQDLVVTTTPQLGAVPVSPGTVDILYGIPDVDGKPTGLFNFGPSYQAGSDPRSVVVTSLDDNFESDVLYANHGSPGDNIPGGVGALLSDGSGLLTSSGNSLVGSNPRMISAGDFNGDGKTDYAAADQADGLLISYGNGNGTFSGVSNVDPYGYGVGVWSADLNADGQPDLMESSIDGTLRVLINGTGKDVTPPLATAIVPDVTSAGAATYKVTIQVTDDTGVLASSLGNGDFRVSGPHGFDQPLTLVSKSTNSNTKSINATFALIPPGGSWDLGDNGTYYVNTQPNKVKDIHGNFALAYSINSFSCAIAPPPTGVISGTVFNDLNRNGIDNSGEPPIASVKVYLDQNNDGAFNGSDIITTTNASGHYQFTKLAGDSTYHVREMVPAGYRSVFSSGKLISVKLNNGQIASSKNFADTHKVLISGTVFHDVNKNGILNAGDSGLANWTVYNDTNNNGKLDTGEASAITDAAGHYSFQSLSAGTFHLREIVKAGHTRTEPGSGVYTFTLTQGGIATGKSFGNT